MLHASCAQLSCPFAFCLLFKPACIKTFVSSLILFFFPPGVYITTLCLLFFSLPCSRSITIWPSLSFRFFELCCCRSGAIILLYSALSLSVSDDVGPVRSGQHLEHNAQRQKAPTHSTRYSAITIEENRISFFDLMYAATDWF